MYNGIAILKDLRAEELDNYLALGWYRMEQTVFTTHFLKRGNNFYSAVWLRYVLSNFSENSSFKKLNKSNKKFKIDISDFVISKEYIELYNKYYTSKEKDWPETLESILTGGTTSNIFNTKVVSIRDDNQLIAAGYFDLGNNSAAGITSFYNPMYSKFSLGRFLMYVKIYYCIDHNIEYFYPGYFVPGLSAFDYKLDMNATATEYYHASKLEWKQISQFKSSELPLHLLEKKLIELKESFRDKNIPSTIAYYGLFNRDVFSTYNCPIFLLIETQNFISKEFAIQFDLTQNRYLIFDCAFFQPSDSLIETDHKLICNCFIHFSEPVFMTRHAEKLIEFILNQ